MKQPVFHGMSWTRVLWPWVPWSHGGVFQSSQFWASSPFRAFRRFSGTHFMTFIQPAELWVRSGNGFFEFQKTYSQKIYTKNTFIHMWKYMYIHTYIYIRWYVHLRMTKDFKIMVSNKKTEATRLKSGFLDIAHDTWAKKKNRSDGLYRGWDPTQLYRDYFIEHYKDPY